MSAIVQDEVDPKMRRRLILTSAAVGAGAGVAVAIPFAFSMKPSARALAAGAPVEQRIDSMEPGQIVTIEYRGAPHWIIRRTKEMIDQLEKHDALLADPKSEDSVQPEFAKNAWRSKNPEFLVLKGVCTHLGCSPTYRKEIAPADLGADWPGGFFCPCHQSKFDLAGRVFKGMPAPKNLVVTPYQIVGNAVVIDADFKGA
jgi:ubiquinol-cytochrome c reductase iron-sulfur subunit